MTSAPQAQARGLRYRGHVARLYPAARQATMLDGQGQTARAVWNLLHEWYSWNGQGGIAKRPSIAEIDRQLREARTNPLPGWEWLALLPAQATQQVLRHYLRTWDRYYKGLARQPRFKKRSSTLAVDNPQASNLRIVRLNRRWGQVTILMVGRVRFRWTRPLPGVSRNCPGRITGARLVRDPLGWHISFRIEEPAVTVTTNPGPPVGVDRGVVHTMALSTGELLDMPQLLSHGEERRLLGLERKAARQQLAYQQRLSRDPYISRSNRQRRTYQQIAALRAREARRRKDWLNKQTTRLAKNHGVIVVEDLRIQNMTRAARGSIDRPGRNVRAKAGLNRSILGMAWGRAGRMLAYKALLHGGVLIRVNARNSSIECASCGHVAPDNRVDQATFRCVSCGHQTNCDINAAQVLLQRGLTARSGAAPGCGGIAREAWTTQPHREPLPRHADRRGSRDESEILGRGAGEDITA